jgi:hypothetical protein
MAYSGVLKITDGTNSVSFLAQSVGVILNDWKPNTGSAKGGAIWSSSQFSDGRQMVMRNWDNITETFDVNITGADMDGSISKFRKLLSLLVLAGAYWMSDYQTGSGDFTKPVWIEARADCESETRYAYVYDGTIPSLSNPYEFPFRGGATETLPIIIEHGVWRDTPPGETECMKTYSYVEREGSTGFVFYPGQETDTVTADLGGAAITQNFLNALSDPPFQHLGIRFVNVDIPQGAKITNAFIRLVSNANSPDVAVGDSTVYGELSANAMTYSDFADWNARIDTAASAFGIPWSSTAFAGQAFYAYDVIDVVQEIVDLGGWSPGNAMAFKFYSPTTLFSINRFYAPFDDPVYDMPALRIEYEIPGAQYGIYLPVCMNNYATGYQTNSQIEHVAVYDASTASYGPNILNTFPSNLFPSPLGVGDILFIGSSFPFANTVFNLASAGDGTVTYTYKYSTAGGVTAGALSNVVEYQFGLFDGVGNTGFMASVFTRPTNWAKNQVGPELPNLYWIAIEITNIAVAPAVIPAQVTQPIYTTAWPFWEVDDEEVNGDINALLKFLLVQIQTLDGAGDDKGAYNHVLFGLRHYNRGADYTPYLNVQANPTGVTFAAGATATTPDNSLAPSGKSINYNVALATAETTIGRWTFSGASLVQQYYGRYRVFVRARVTAGAAGVAGFRAQLVETVASNVLLETDLRYSSVSAIPGYDLIDLGYITFKAAGGLVYTTIDIVLRAVTTAASTFDVLDLILFPVDETTLEINTNDDSIAFSYDNGTNYPGEQPLHDSTMPKEGPYSGVVDQNNGLLYTMQTKSLGPFTIPNKARMRVYFLPWNDEDGELKGTESLFDCGFRRVQQYLNMRGEE